MMKGRDADVRERAGVMHRWRADLRSVDGSSVTTGEKGDYMDMITGK